MKKNLLTIFNLLILIPTLALADVRSVAIQWEMQDIADVQGYKIYYSYSNDMTDQEMACETDDPTVTELTCSNVNIERYPVYFTVAAVLTDGESVSTPRELYPPYDVKGFSATSGDSQISLTWINPTESDFVGVMIRYKTIEGIECTDSDYPANYTDGELVGDFPGELGASGSYVHSGLNANLRYCYSAFSYDSYQNYSHTTHASAQPLAVDDPPVAPTGVKIMIP